MKKIIFFFVFVLLGVSAPASAHGADSLKNEMRNNAQYCGQIVVITDVIAQAIAIGAPTYNDGNQAGCYLIYEGVAYKILHHYGKKCKDVRSILETAISKSHGNFSVSDKAWIMRMAFDQILGVPTSTK